MTRIAVTGTENSHVDHFVRHLNVEKRHGDARVSVLVGGDGERNRRLAVAGRIDVVVDTPDDAVGLVDAAIVSSRDGRSHLAEAKPFLDAGVPVLVDKPLAASTTDAEAILAAARRGRALVTSFSALRFAPDLGELAAGIGDVGTVRAINVTGPADPDSEHAGLFFYGIHIVEMAMQLLDPVAEQGTTTGGPVAVRHPAPVTVHVDRVPGCVTAVTTMDGVQLVLTFVTPSAPGSVPFHAGVIGTTGVRAREIALPHDYCAPGLARFMEMVATRRPLLDDAALLRPVQVLEAIVTSPRVSRSVTRRG